MSTAPHAGPSRRGSPAPVADPSGVGAEPGVADAAAAALDKPEVPWAFIDCPTDTLVILISHMLNLLMAHNDQVLLTPDALTRFHSRAAPGITVIDYLRRIVKYTNMEKIPLLSLLAYIDTTCQHLPTFTLSSLTVHRFLIAGVCAGSKAQCDVFCTNAHYAKVGGIKVQELNGLEREFLKVTKWNLCCNADLLQRYYSSLIRSHGGYTQAAQPDRSPFRPFPRSASKPPSPRNDVDEDVGEEGEVAMEEDADLLEEGDEEMAEDTGNGPSSGELPPESTSPGSSSGSRQQASPVDHPRGHKRVKRLPRSTTDSHKTGAGDDMDVDQTSPTNATAPIAIPNNAAQYSPASAAGSSSVPSSSRSSLHRIGSFRGRTMSMTFTDPRPATPRLDTTTAAAAGLDFQRPGPSSSPRSRQVSGAGSTGTAQPRRPDSAASLVGSQGSGEHGKLLRNLVGGLFTRRGHSDKTTSPSAEVVREPPEHPPHSAVSAPAGQTHDQGDHVVRGNGLTPRVRTRVERSADSVSNGVRKPPRGMSLSIDPAEQGVES